MNYLSERQEIVRGMVEDKIMMQNRATEKNYEQIFEEMKELEEKKSEDALPTQVIGGGSRRRDGSGVSEKDSGRASGDE